MALHNEDTDGIIHTYYRLYIIHTVFQSFQGDEFGERSYINCDSCNLKVVGIGRVQGLQRNKRRQGGQLKCIYTISGFNIHVIASNNTIQFLLQWKHPRQNNGP